MTSLQHPPARLHTPRDPRRWAALAVLASSLLVVVMDMTILNVALAGMVWQTILADLGSRLRLTVAARIFFVGQLGKYLPGSVWPVVMQTRSKPARISGLISVRPTISSPFSRKEAI
jgi:hypothetical protein